jgi:hypothetical protein
MAGVMTDKQVGRRTRLVAEDLGSHLAPHEQRAASASDDRKLRSTMLAANSGRLLATLEAERGKLGLEDGYHAPVGPTGEKPMVPDAYLHAPRADVSSAAPPLEDLLDDRAIEAGDTTSGPPVLRVAPEPATSPTVPSEGIGGLATEPDGPATPEPEAPPVGARPASEPARAEAGSAEPAPLGPIDLAIPQLIRELASLHADGILTDDEFTEKKRELLARL